MELHVRRAVGNREAALTTTISLLSRVARSKCSCNSTPLALPKRSLASGIASAAMVPIHAVAGIAGRIKNYFVGHSPPPLGPLHELNRVHIIETIAETMKPAPMMAAIQRIAQMAAITVRLAITGPATMAFAATTCRRLLRPRRVSRQREHRWRYPSQCRRGRPGQCQAAKVLQ